MMTSILIGSSSTHANFVVDIVPTSVYRYEFGWSKLGSFLFDLATEAICSCGVTVCCGVIVGHRDYCCRFVLSPYVALLHWNVVLDAIILDAVILDVVALGYWCTHIMHVFIGLVLLIFILYWSVSRGHLVVHTPTWYHTAVEYRSLLVKCMWLSIISTYIIVWMVSLLSVWSVVNIYRLLFRK